MVFSVSGVVGPTWHGNLGRTVADLSAGFFTQAQHLEQGEQVFLFLKLPHVVGHHPGLAVQDVYG